MELPYSGMRLEEVEIENDKYKEIIAKSNSPSKIEYKHLTSLGKIISRIVSYNILPKTESFTHISNDQFKAMYAIVKHLEVNWARVIYETIKTIPSTFLAFPKSIIKLLKANKISLTRKEKTCEVVKDYSMIKRMGLDREDRNEELEETPETPVASHTEPSSSTTQEISNATIFSQNVVILEQLKKMSEDFKVFSETVSIRCDKLDSRNEEIWSFMRALVLKKRLKFLKKMLHQVRFKFLKKLLHQVTKGKKYWKKKKKMLTLWKMNKFRQ